jgi:hypothetical protein
LATSVEQSASTWKAPYHLLTFLMTIMRQPPALYLTCSRLTAYDAEKQSRK